MLNIVRFLEKMGSDAHWNEISMEQMELALAEAGIEGPVRSAILNKDVAGLQALFRQKPLIGYVIPAEEEEEEEEDEGEPNGKRHYKNTCYLPSFSLASSLASPS